jgi:hypothetical protein
VSCEFGVGWSGDLGAAEGIGATEQEPSVSVSAVYQEVGQSKNPVYFVSLGLPNGVFSWLYEFSNILPGKCRLSEINIVIAHESVCNWTNRDEERQATGPEMKAVKRSSETLALDRIFVSCDSNVVKMKKDFGECVVMCFLYTRLFLEDRRTV